MPQRPSLEQLKKQAKSLLHAARAADRAALERFHTLPALSRRSLAELGAVNLALHDAQSVIAREHGFKSWRELREHVEEQSLTFAGAVEQLVRDATGSAAARALRLLALHPGIAHANLYTELVLGDAAAVKERLRKQPDLARQPGGMQSWEPLLYVCHTCLHQGAPERAAGLVAVARELLSNGANPNANADTRAAGVRWLLDHGADANIPWGELDEAPIHAPVDALEGMFAGTPLVWAAQGWSQGARAGRDYLGVARQLIAAGSPLDWNAPEKAPDPERMQEQLAELCRAAAGSAP